MKYFILFGIAFIHINLSGQSAFNYQSISEFKWELDKELYLKMENDSNFFYDVKYLFHVKESDYINSGYVYYPADIGEEFIEDVNKKDFVPDIKNYKTLWSALHATIGGGWAHFTHCLLYAFETRHLTLTAPLMKRPESDWKPNPPTQSYLRTKKWKYYVPVEYKNAIKEYKIRKANNELGDLKGIPQEFIDLFLITDTKKYQLLIEKNDVNTLAKIDLVRLLLGVNYLSEPQISYIRSAVLTSLQNFTIRKLPSVIIFDEFNAAAILSLDSRGYKIERLAFKEAETEDTLTVEQKTVLIEDMIQKINDYNYNFFVKNIEKYYQK